MNNNIFSSMPVDDTAMWEVDVTYKGQHGENEPPRDEVHVVCNQRVSDDLASFQVHHACDENEERSDEQKLKALKQVANEIAFRLNFYNRTSSIKG